MPKYTTIDAYIADFPEDVQTRLEAMREAIREAAPDAEETLFYQVPAFKLIGNLVQFAAFKNHIGFYPEPSGIEAFKAELAEYQTATSTIRFPFKDPIPFDLVRRIVEFRVKENLAKG